MSSAGLPPLDWQRVQGALGPRRVVGRRLVYLDRTTSTNDIASRLARDGEPEGTVVVTDEQSAGRGRLGRTWVAPPNSSVLASVVLRPVLPPSLLAQLTMAAAVAVAEAVAKVARAVTEIKWPNDVLVEGRKLAGILAEAELAGDEVVWTVVGIGVNVNVSVPELVASPLRKGDPVEGCEEIAPLLDATSLLEVCGKQVSREDLLIALLEGFDARYRQLRHGDAHAVWQRWYALCSTIGTRVSISLTPGPRPAVVGTAEAVDSMGRLGLRTDDGQLCWLNHGEVSVRPAAL